jgi:hypothetical protein
MSRSSQPRSSIVAKLRENSAAILPSSLPARSRRRRFNIKFAKLMRWLHIYLSMFSLAVVLFFSVTGITLNHPSWFYNGAESTRESEGQIDLTWLHSASGAPAASADDPAALAREVSKLEVVEHLRSAHAIGGALADFRVDEHECLVSFKGPGYAADAFIDRDTGRYRLTQTYHGFIALLNDLHKGRDTGPVWSVLIDVSAVLMTAIALSGLILLFYLKLRRKTGVIVVLVGAVVAIVLFRIWVP